MITECEAEFKQFGYSPRCDPSEAPGPAGLGVDGGRIAYPHRRRRLKDPPLRGRVQRDRAGLQEREQSAVQTSAHSRASTEEQVRHGTERGGGDPMDETTEHRVDDSGRTAAATNAHLVG